MNNTNTWARPALTTANLVATIVTLCASGTAVAQDDPAPFAQSTHRNDTYVGARYANDFHFPGSAAKVKQKIGFVTTAGDFAYGNYVFNADYLVSDRNNPEANGSSGAQEIYSVGRIEFSAGKITGKPMGVGIIRDFGLTTGYEFSSKNDAFGSRARMLVLGPTVQFAIPRGFWNFTAGVRTETNHNGIARSDVHYDAAWHLESAWLVPFNVGPTPLVFKGFVTTTGPKGKDGFHVETKTETLTRMSLLVDVGAWAGQPRTVFVGPGYEYWKNMFGTPPSEAPGTRRSAFVLVAEVHF